MPHQVQEIMTTDPVAVSPQVTMAEAARLMRDKHIGDVLLTEEGHLRGVITDRDMAVRGLAEDLRATRRWARCAAPISSTAHRPTRWTAR